jgi:ribosomal protein S21
MSVTVYKNPKESFDRLVSRFNKKVQSSRILLTVRNKRYHSRPVTKRLIRQAAIMREYYRSKKDKMQFY